MSSVVRHLCCLLPFLLVVSCSTYGPSEDDSIEKGPTLADLRPAIMPEKNKGLPKVDLDTLIKVYKEVLAVTQEPQLQLQVMQRLAGLDMKRGEQNLAEEQQTGQFQLAIQAYKRLLETAPDQEKNDQLKYQLSKAYDLSGEVEKSIKVLDSVVSQHPDSIHYDEAQFRRAEQFFSKSDYFNAEKAYAQVIERGKSGRYYKNALYMHGWSMFKLQRYLSSLPSFVGVLDINITQDRYVGIKDMNIPPDDNLENLSRGDRDLTLDVLRAISVVFSYLDGPDTIAKVLGELGERHYVSLVYSQLGKLYLQNERYRDSAETYRAFVNRYPQSNQSPVFYSHLIDSYIAGAFSQEVLKEKELYIDRYGIKSDFWRQKSIYSQDYIRPYLKQYLPELAGHYHATAQTGAKLLSASSRKGRALTVIGKNNLSRNVAQNYLKAGNYYQEYIDTFPDDEQVPEMYFLLAESRFEAGEFIAAIDAYETVAYSYAYHKRGTEAGYSAIIAYGDLLKKLNQANPINREQVENWLRLKIASQLRFSETFYDDKRATKVLAKAAEELLQLGEYHQALEAAEVLVQKQPPAENALLKTAWLVIGHSQFELAKFDQAEIAYQQTLQLSAANDSSRAAIADRLAASVYKQGELALSAGDQLGAARQFLRVALVAPASAISITAQYDAASAYIAAASWAEAIAVLTQFRRLYPTNKLNADVPAKLVSAYQGSGQWGKAAAELTTLYNTSTDESVRRESVYLAAELYEKADNMPLSIARYKQYIAAYPDPFDLAMEARSKICDLYVALNEQKNRRKWLKKIIAADATAGSKRTDRSRYLAALASTVFANDAYQVFKTISLKLPLKNSLKNKKRALSKALKAYKLVVDYGVQEFATQATFRIASIYEQLSKDLMASERPKDLDELALEEYMILLEEQAFPFEEKSITIHEANIRRSWQGLYDAWIRQSFTSLSVLLPARYGKNEGGMGVDNEIY